MELIGFALVALIAGAMALFGSGIAPTANVGMEHEHAVVYAEQWRTWRNDVVTYAEAHAGNSPPSPCWSASTIGSPYAAHTGWACIAKFSAGQETLFVWGAFKSRAIAAMETGSDGDWTLGTDCGGNLCHYGKPLSPAMTVPSVVPNGAALSVTAFRG